MAAMDMRRARAIAEQKIKSGQNRGLGLEDLVQQIIAESAGAGAPGTAIGAALVPVTVNPANPAPMQPGVPLIGPKPTTEMVPQPQEQELPVAPQRAARPSRYQPELDRVMANIAVAEQAMAGKQPNVTDRIRLGELKRQAEVLGALARAEQSPEAEIPEEMRAAMEGRQARIARREELLAEQQARSPFAALLAAGAAGTQGRRGETDVEAITRILQAGFGGYDQSRRGFEEGTENIAEARDQAMIDRYNMQEKAREAARQRALEVIGIGEKAEDRAVRDVRLPTQLATEAAQAKEAGIKAESAQAIINASIERDLASAAYARGLGRQPAGDGDKVDVEKRMAGQALQALADDYDAAAAVYNASLRDNGMMASMVPAEVKSAFLAAQAKLKSRSSSYARTYGSSPFIQNERPRATARQTATAAGTADPLGIRR
jgi:hypothetical protein